MASNGRVGLRSGSPSFLVVGLSLVIIVLLYSYWSVSSRNSMLLRDQSFLHDRLRSLTSQKLAMEKKKSSAMAQIANMEKTKRQLEGNVQSSSKEKSQLNSKITELEQNLEQEKKKTATLQSQQSKSKAELQKLKGETDQTTEKLKELTNKTHSFVDMYKGLKETLAKKHDELFKVQNDWHVCRVQLKKLKEEHHAAGGEVDSKKESEPVKGTSNAFLPDMSRLKKQIKQRAAKLASQQKVNTQPGLQKQGNVVSQVDRNITSQKKPSSGTVTVAFGKQSGNDTNKATSTKNTTTTTTTTMNTRSTNTTTNTDKQAENKHNTTKPPKNEAGSESDEESPDNKHEKSPEEKESESEDEQTQDEDKHDNNPFGHRAQPIGLKYPKRQGSDQYV